MAATSRGHNFLSHAFSLSISQLFLVFISLLSHRFCLLSARHRRRVWRIKEEETWSYHKTYAVNQLRRSCMSEISIMRKSQRAWFTQYHSPLSTAFYLFFFGLRSPSLSFRLYHACPFFVNSCQEERTFMLTWRSYLGVFDKSVVLCGTLFFSVVVAQSFFFHQYSLLSLILFARSIRQFRGGARASLGSLCLHLWFAPRERFAWKRNLKKKPGKKSKYPRSQTILGVLTCLLAAIEEWERDQLIYSNVRAFAILRNLRKGFVFFIRRNKKRPQNDNQTRWFAFTALARYWIESSAFTRSAPRSIASIQHHSRWQKSLDPGS